MLQTARARVFMSGRGQHVTIPAEYRFSAEEVFTFYTLQSGGQSITFVGDLIHVLAVQMPNPSITIVYDVDPAEAARVREQAFLTFAHDRILVAIPHVSFPGVGYLRAVDSGYEWIPVPYGNRDRVLKTDCQNRHSASAKP